MAEKLPPEVDTSRPSIARVYDAALGGKDNFDVDRELLERLVARNPHIPPLVKEGRRFIRRVVRWLATEAGIEQFLDLGSGLPTVQNVHDVAQRANPDATVVYVDNDPAAIAHGRALLADDQRSFFAAGDLTRPEELLADPAVGAHLLLDQPIALLQCATLHFVPELDDAERIMRSYVNRLAPGSYVVVTHVCRPEEDDERYEDFANALALYRESVPGFTPRTAAEVARLLPGLELMEPGVVPFREWWPEGPEGDETPSPDLFVGAVARKP